jgi:hypothetical protein
VVLGGELVAAVRKKSPLMTYHAVLTINEVSHLKQTVRLCKEEWEKNNNN